ncbi:MAG TPA: stage II sporulation protein M [Thermoanaerobaculia bacterium]|nr:stage II sporulation protein M [Thermoanaerobaculia bacterium]
MSFALKSAQFRKEREGAWRELEELLDRVEKKGLRSLTAAELNRLPILYRSATSSLSVAQAISLDKNLLDYLNALVGRAYLSVYSTKRKAVTALVEFFTYWFPHTFRRYFVFMAASTALLLLGVLTGYQMTVADPERYYSFVGEDMASGRNPAASTEELREVLYFEEEDGWLGAFATYLFTHNSKVGMLCFATGFAAGLPVIYLLFTNGLLLGAMAALYDSRGLGFEFWGWVLPHGVTELGAVCLCGAAGMVLGSSLVFPGRHTRLQNLAIRGREAAVLAVGAVALFFLAGLIEGIFRQLVHNLAVRWTVVGATTVFWTWYFLFLGRNRERRLVD